jgi:hypothetical protein
MDLIKRDPVHKGEMGLVKQGLKPYLSDDSRSGVIATRQKILIQARHVPRRLLLYYVYVLIRFRRRNIYI